MRRKVCLSKISVFLDGDIPIPDFDVNPAYAFTNMLKNHV